MALLLSKKSLIVAWCSSSHIRRAVLYMPVFFVWLSNISCAHCSCLSSIDFIFFVNYHNVVCRYLSWFGLAWPVSTYWFYNVESLNLSFRVPFVNKNASTPAVYRAMQNIINAVATANPTILTISFFSLNLVMFEFS